jgi:hypothetical protein
MQHRREGWTATRWGARLFDGKAVRTIDGDECAASSLEHFILAMSQPLTKLLEVFSAVIHSNWTKSPPLTDKAIIALGEIKILASSQLFPASINSVISICRTLLET